MYRGCGIPIAWAMRLTRFRERGNGEELESSSPVPHFIWTRGKNVGSYLFMHDGAIKIVREEP